MDITVTNNLAKSRFEIACDEHLAFLEYKISENIMTLIHTEVPEDLGGKGLGGKLVRFALEHAQQNHLKVVAHCEFAQNYIKRHMEYSHLLSNT
jgi:predicted GNAT family acetyltransferase